MVGVANMQMSCQSSNPGLPVFLSRPYSCCWEQNHLFSTYMILFALYYAYCTVRLIVLQHNTDAPEQIFVHAWQAYNGHRTDADVVPSRCPTIAIVLYVDFG